MNSQNVFMGENLQELTVHGKKEFPIQYYADELFRLPGCQFPLHWHTEIEFFAARGGSIKAQIGRLEFLLEEGDGVFVNSNVLHSFSQLRPEDRCRCPNVVFSGELIAPADHLIYQKYIGPLLSSRQLPCVILKPSIPWQNSILSCLDRLFSLMQKHALKEERRPLPLLSFDSPADDIPCWEMQVQNELNRIWQLLISHAGEIPPVNIEKGEASLQIRMQKMLAFIRSHYASPVSLDEIAASASISKSEASRCFQAYMNQPPVSYLLDFRLEKAKQLLSSTPDTVEEISRKCGFRSSGYFCRIFKRRTGASPNQYRRETT